MWRYILPTERLYIDKDKIIARNASGIEVFNTNWNFIKTQSNGQFKIGGYNQTPIFTLTERTYFQYNGAGSGSNISLGIVEVIDNTYIGGQLAYVEKMGPSPAQYLQGGKKWGYSLTFWLPPNDTGYCSWNLEDGLHTIIPHSSETPLRVLGGDYYNPHYTYDDAGTSINGVSELLDIKINNVVAGKFRWYAIDSGSYWGTGRWTSNIYIGPPILVPGMLDYWKQGGLVEFGSPPNSTATNGYYVDPQFTGFPPDSHLTIFAGVKAPVTAGLSYTL